jgi:hypothetical protein
VAADLTLLLLLCLSLAECPSLPLSCRWTPHYRERGLIFFSISIFLIWLMGSYHILLPLVML